jgi:prolyl oligopeptidase
MRHMTSAVTVFFLAGAASCLGQTRPDNSPALVYPETKTVEVVDDYHGTKVPDPYRWLENLDAPDVKAWIEAQNRLTFDYLESIPARAAIRKRLTDLQDFERFSAPEQVGGRYFFTRNSGLQNQSVLYVADGLNNTPRVLLDPMAPSPSPTPRSPTTANCSPMASPMPVPTGPSSASATSTPDRTCPTPSNG